MECPRCREGLRRADRAGVEIDFCSRCRGVWLDGGELEKLLDRSGDYYPPSYSQESFRRDDRDHRHDEHRHHDHDHGRRQEHGYGHSHGGHSGHGHDGHGHKRHKKKGFLGELFDIFD